MRRFLSLTCLVASPIALAAQSTTELGVAAAEAGLLDGVGLELQADGTGAVALGPAFRVLFEPNRIEYHPLLGAAAPRLQHLGFELLSIELGGEPLVEVRATTPSIEGLVATYDRGAILERYEARADGLEQTFTLLADPGVAGDLVVRGRLDTSADVRLSQHTNEGLAFTHAAFGGITLGGVTGLSADGRTRAGRLEFDGEVVTYVLPREFVDQATFPLVLDPLFGTAQPLDPAALEPGITPDVAYDPANDTFLAVWARIYALGDTDVIGREIDGTTFAMGPTFFVKSVIGSVVGEPSAAFVRGADAFVVAYSQGSLLGQKDVLARGYFTGGSLTNEVVLGGGSSNQIRPSVGGENVDFSSATEALVVWEDTSTGIWAAQFAPRPGGASFAFDTTHLFVGSEYSRPTISKSGGVLRRWMVACERFFTVPAPGDSDLAHFLVDRELTIVTPTTGTGTVGFDELSPAVAGEGDEFLLAWQSDEPSYWEARFRFFDGTGFGGPVRSILASTAIDQENLRAAFTGSRYVLLHEYPTSFGGNLGITEICRDTQLICQQPGPLQPVSVPRRLAALGTKWDGEFGETSNVGFLAWQQDGGSSTVHGRPFTGLGGGAITNLGGGCGNSVQVVVEGPPALGNTNFGWTVNATGGATFVIMNARLNSPSPFICGPCQIEATLGIVQAAALTGGNASFQTPIPGDPTLTGRTVTAQFFTFPTTSSPCPIFANASASDRIRAALAP